MQDSGHGQSLRHDYFVSAENTPYYHWQLELLLESFKGLKNDLLVAMANWNAPTSSHFCRNIFLHERFYGHDNLGRSASLNSAFSLLHCVREKLIVQPFVVLQPDMVLKKPVVLEFGSNNFPEMTLVPDPEFTVEFAEEHVGPFRDWIGGGPKNWIPFGRLFSCFNVPLPAFERVAELTLLFMQKGGKDEYANRLAWSVALSEFERDIYLKPDYSLAESMLGGGNAPVIDYRHGLPPVFNKKQFTYPEHGQCSFGDPFEPLVNNSPTPNALFMSELARISMDARGKVL